MTLPPGYVEGSFMVKRKGVYYLMWSEGGWTGPDYSVAYAMGPSPTGPFKSMARRVCWIVRQSVQCSVTFDFSGSAKAPPKFSGSC